MSDVIEPPYAGSLVTEVGVRQAWLFINFYSSESAEEKRLFLDTNWSLGGTSFNLDHDELEVGLMALCSLLNKTLAGDAQTQGANLVLVFEGGPELRIDGTGAAATTHDVCRRHARPVVRPCPRRRHVDEPGRGDNHAGPD